MKDHNSGAKEQAEEGGAGGAGPNVVPFPRSWYGSVEELVPIDPEPSPGAGHRSTQTDASAFWGGEGSRSSDAEQTSAGQRGAEPELATVELGWDDGAAQDPDTPADERARSAGPIAPERFPTAHEAAGSARRRKMLGTVLGLALIALAAGMMGLGGRSGGDATGRSGRRATARRPVMTVTQTVPQTTTVVQTITTRRTESVPHRSAPRVNRPNAPHQSAPLVSHPTVVSAPQMNTTAANSVQSPRSSDPSSGTASQRVTSAASGGGTAPRAGSSKPSCAPSVTNGGGCSL